MTDDIRKAIVGLLASAARILFLLGFAIHGFQALATFVGWRAVADSTEPIGLRLDAWTLLLVILEVLALFAWISSAHARSYAVHGLAAPYGLPELLRAMRPGSGGPKVSDALREICANLLEDVMAAREGRGIRQWRILAWVWFANESVLLCFLVLGVQMPRGRFFAISTYSLVWASITELFTAMLLSRLNGWLEVAEERSLLSDVPRVRDPRKPAAPVPAAPPPPVRTPEVPPAPAPLVVRPGPAMVDAPPPRPVRAVPPPPPAVASLPEPLPLPVLQPSSAVAFGPRAAARAVDLAGALLSVAVSRIAAAVVLAFLAEHALASERWPSRLGFTNLAVVPLLLLATFLGQAVAEGVGGATLGKALLGLRVLGDEHRAAAPLRVLLRNLSLVVDGLFLGGPAWASMRESSWRKRLGDHVARTVVVGAPSVPDARRVGLRPVWSGVAAGVSLLFVLDVMFLVLAAS